MSSQRRWSIPRMLLASGNPHKHREIQRILDAPPGSLVVPADLTGQPPDPVEDGGAYAANAIIKATAFARWSGLPSLADDSGLEVDRLGGRPGVHSARYAGEGATSEDNVRRLLGELRDAPESERRARFVCVIVICNAEKVLLQTEGVCSGRITTEPQGQEGFGYDPVFVPDGESRTFAELSAAEKDRLSHRGRALRALATLLGQGPPG